MKNKLKALLVLILTGSAGVASAPAIDDNEFMTAIRGGLSSIAAFMEKVEVDICDKDREEAKKLYSDYKGELLRFLSDASLASTSSVNALQRSISCIDAHILRKAKEAEDASLAAAYSLEESNHTLAKNACEATGKLELAIAARQNTFDNELKELEDSLDVLTMALSEKGGNPAENSDILTLKAMIQSLYAKFNEDCREIAERAAEARALSESRTVSEFSGFLGGGGTSD
jgi:hypothetical protein